MQKSFVFIQITDSHWRLIQAVRENGQTFIRRCVIIPSADTAALTAGVRSFCSQAGKPDVHLSLPRRKIVVRRLRLPSCDPAELRKMIGLQLLQQIPYAPGEVVWDYSVTETSDGYTSVQVWIALQRFVEECLNMIGSAGSVRRITVSSFGILHGFSARPPSDQTVCVVAVDHPCSELIVVRRGTLVFSRCLPDNDELFRHIRESLDLFHKEYPDLEIQKFVLTGPTAENLKAEIADQWNVEAEIFDPLEVRRDRNILEKIPDPCGWAQALGHLIGADSAGIDLSPPSLLNRHLSQERFRNRLTAGMLSTVILALAALLMLMEPLMAEIRLRQIKAQENRLSADVRKASLTVERTQALDDYFHERAFVSEMMAEIYQRTPEDVVYQSIVQNKDGSVILQGYAQSPSGVNDLQSRLIGSPGFQDVRLEYSTKRRMGNAEVTDFKIQGRRVSGRKDAS